MTRSHRAKRQKGKIRTIWTLLWSAVLSFYFSFYFHLPSSVRSAPQRSCVHWAEVILCLWIDDDSILSPRTCNSSSLLPLWVFHSFLCGQVSFVLLFSHLYLDLTPPTASVCFFFLLHVIFLSYPAVNLHPLVSMCAAMRLFIVHKHRVALVYEYVHHFVRTSSWGK